MLTGTFNLYGIMDGENARYMRLTCSLPVISVDENNVQADAAVFRLVEVNGSTQTVIPAWFRLKVMSGNAVIDTIDQTAVKDELSYMLPTDRYGNADKLLVEAYRDDHDTEGSYDRKLAELTVPVARRNPIPFPRPEEWSAGLTFHNGEYLMVGNIVYMWRNPVPGNSELPPQQDIEQNPQTTSWVAYQNWPLLATQVFLAQWAKLGSFIFNGDIQMSQQGEVNGKESFDYRNPGFDPNFMVNALTGEVVARVIRLIGGEIAGISFGNGVLGAEGTDGGALFSKSGVKVTTRSYDNPDNDSEKGGFSEVLLGKFIPASSGADYVRLWIDNYMKKYDSMGHRSGSVRLATYGGAETNTLTLIARGGTYENIALTLEGGIRVLAGEEDKKGATGQTVSIGLMSVWDSTAGKARSMQVDFTNGILTGWHWTD